MKIIRRVLWSPLAPLASNEGRHRLQALRKRRIERLLIDCGIPKSKAVPAAGRIVEEVEKW